MGCTSSHKMPDDDAYDKFIGRTSNFYNATMSDADDAEDEDMREKLMVQRKAKEESEKSKQQENKVCKFLK
jgi:hypothetical protein